VIGIFDACMIGFDAARKSDVAPDTARRYCEEFGSSKEHPVWSRSMGAVAVSGEHALHTRRTDPADAVKLSRLLWDIDWRSWLPRRLTEDGIEFHLSSIEAAMPFVSAHYAEIFEQDLERDGFFSEPFDGPKMRYYRTADVFEIRHAGRTIGLLIGAPSDWSTYYIRSMAVLPAYQGRQLPRCILPFLFERLAKAGVRRFEADTSPSNLVSVRSLTRLRFNITGTVLTERWGALLRFTKFVDEGAEEVFLDKFCSGVRYQQRCRKSGIDPHQ
jgi:RimJ/RimL family protein N-acetyltransferase